MENPWRNEGKEEKIDAAPAAIEAPAARKKRLPKTRLRNYNKAEWDPYLKSGCETCGIPVGKKRCAVHRFVWPWATYLIMSPSMPGVHYMGSTRNGSLRCTQHATQPTPASALITKRCDDWIFVFNKVHLTPQAFTKEEADRWIKDREMALYRKLVSGGVRLLNRYMPSHFREYVRWRKDNPDASNPYSEAMESVALMYEERKYKGQEDKALRAARNKRYRQTAAGYERIKIAARNYYHRKKEALEKRRAALQEERARDFAVPDEEWWVPDV